MVAHDVADVSFLFAVVVRRRAFFQEDPSIVFFAVWLFVAPFDKVEVEPGFVMATLVSRAETQSFMVNGECAELTNFPLSIRIRRFEESTNVRPLTWNCPRSPTMVWGHGQSAIFSIQKKVSSSSMSFCLPHSNGKPLYVFSPHRRLSVGGSSVLTRSRKITFFIMPQGRRPQRPANLLKSDEPP